MATANIKRADGGLPDLIRKRRSAAMATDERDILELLKAELDFIEKGGYGRSVRTPWLPTSVFQDAPTCVCFPYHTHDDECALMQFVPLERRSEAVPCHFIPLNKAGETAAELEARG